MKLKRFIKKYAQRLSGAWAILSGKSSVFELTGSMKAKMDRELLKELYEYHDRMREKLWSVDPVKAIQHEKYRVSLQVAYNNFPLIVTPTEFKRIKHVEAN